MAAVYVSICHADDFVITQLGDVKVRTDSSTKSGNHRPNFLIGKSFVQSCFFHIEDFSTQGKNCLVLSVSSLFCGASCGESLYKEHLALAGVLFRAVCKLARQGGAFQYALSAG